MKKILLTLAVCSLAPLSQAAVIQFNLMGSAGPGLLAGNEPGVVSGGSGGEFSTGITFDDVSKLISISVNWGSANGYTNLTGVSTNAHLHITGNPNGNNGVADFIQTGGPALDLQMDAVNFTTNTSASGGSIVGSATLNGTNEAALLAGKLYLNVHTATNGGGEMRGFLVQIPEPSASLMSITALGVLALRRRRA